MRSSHVLGLSLFSLLAACGGRSDFSVDTLPPSVVESSAGGKAGSSGASGSSQGGAGVGGKAGAAGSVAGTAGAAGSIGGAAGTGGVGGAAGSTAGTAGKGGSPVGGSAGTTSGTAGAAGSVAGAGGATCSGGVPLFEPCKTCVDVRCCGESQSCNADFECRSLLDCALGCGASEGCLNQCFQAFPGGFDLLNPLGNCIENQGCEQACEITGEGGAGGVGGSPVGPGGSAGVAGSPVGGSAGAGGVTSCELYGETGSEFCDDCLNTQCCDVGFACVESSQCLALLDCLGTCGDGSCQQKCVETFPEGLPGVQGIIDCSSVTCGSVCNGGTGGAGGQGGAGGSEPFGGSAGTGGDPFGGAAGTGGASFCGDGVVSFGEQCDAGPGNVDLPALQLILQGFPVEARPVLTPASGAGFYNYFSASSHTGFEEVFGSKIMLHQDTTTGLLSLVVHHGIDQDTSNITQPQTQVGMKISGPGSMVVSLADDTGSEFQTQGPGFVVGSWSFQANSDGGVIGGLPFPGNWQTDVSTSFDKGIQFWQWVDGSGNLFGLTLNGTISIRSNAGPSAGLCRTDCTVITCGDGRLDAGEQCDDGNPFGGDGCNSFCQVENAIDN